MKSNGVAQQRQLEQNKTLVKAYWEFEEGQNHWLGFSPKVSVLLEAAYQNWLQHPSEVRSQIHANGFLYNVDYTTLLEEGQRQSQRIRRVGVTADNGHDKAYCTVDPALWQEMQIKLQSFREEQEWLLRLLRSDQHGATEKADVKSDGFYGALAEEVSRLWQRVGRQAEELEVLRSQVERSRQLLERLRTAVLPGRLVWAAGRLGVASAVESQQVHVNEGEGQDWVVPKEEVRRAPLGLLARPGSKVLHPHEGRSLKGVVCGTSLPRASDEHAAVCSDAGDVHESRHCVDVLRADGRCSRMPLAWLELRESGVEGQPFSVGDVVRARENDSFGAVDDGPPPGTLGTILQVSEDLSSECDSIFVRFPDGMQSFRDVAYTEAQANEGLEVDEAVDRIRPGVAVRLRPCAASCGTPSREIGVVFALHGDATAVVDFLSNWGHHCSASDLEVVEDPPSMEVELISALSECLTWNEMLDASLLLEPVGLTREMM